MKYDVAIIGGGPAGISAGIFTCNAGLNTICFEKLAVGGQASLTYEIGNYPGLGIISGFDLGEKFYNHALDAGLKFQYETVLKLTKLKSGFSIKTKDATYQAKKVIIACGNKVRKLGLENEEKFTGKGVSYCASCDGRLYKNKTVAIVGGGDSAFKSVDYLTRLAKKVYLINRSEHFKAGKHKLEQAKKYKNLEIITNTNVVKLYGEKVLKSIDVNNLGKVKNIKIDGLFINIGYVPDFEFVSFDLEKDEHGYIVVDKNQQTSVKNLYACGDVTSKSFKQVISACADGARAGNSCIGD